jgi:hypothetical protein
MIFDAFKFLSVLLVGRGSVSVLVSDVSLLAPQSVTNKQRFRKMSVSATAE